MPTMQTDVLAATLTTTGFFVKFRTRVKGISLKGTDQTAQFSLFDSTTDPVAGTYTRALNVITVTSNNHGFKVGDNVGIACTSGNGTSGNYVVATVPDANTFTVTDINSGTVTSSNCLISGRWIVTFKLAAGDLYTNYWILPGEGILAQNGVHATLTNLTSSTIFYG
jgi:hypothetical protein